jgi:hypothetical protein
MERFVEARDVQIIVEESRMKSISEMVDLFHGILPMGLA